MAKPKKHWKKARVLSQAKTKRLGVKDIEKEKEMPDSNWASSVHAVTAFAFGAGRIQSAEKVEVRPY